MMAATQWRATDGGIYGLDFTAVCLVAQAMNVEVNEEFVSKVRAYEEEALLLQIKKNDDICTEKEREYCRLQFGEDYFIWSCEQCEDMREKKRKAHG